MLAQPIAKINIGLNVVERRADGYHNIETVFYPIPLNDNLEVKPLEHSAEPYLLQVVGQKIEGTPAQNLVVRVYESLKQEFSLPPLDIYLFKRIPSGAGLGGGSSDAAEMMKLLVQMFSLPLSESDMEKRLAKFGADCAFFVKARPSFATGIGDILTPISLSLKGYTLLLVKPADFVSTAAAYAGVTPKRPAADLREALARPPKEWRGVVVNDFEESVFPQFPRIAAIKQTLYDMGADYAAMSGSGSAVYGLFRSPLEQVNPKKIFSDCFVFQSLLRS